MGEGETRKHHASNHAASGFSPYAVCGPSAEISQDAVHVPVPSLRPLQDLPALLCQFWLSALVRGLAKEYGLPRLSLRLAIPGLFSLGLFELLLDRCGPRELFRVDGLGDLVPELKRLMWQLLL